MKTEAHTKTQKHVLSLVQKAQKSSTLITLKELKEKTKTSMRKIVEAAEDMCLCVNVGMQTDSGHGMLLKADWTIEDLNAPYHED